MNYWSKINFSNATRNIHLKNNLKARSSSTYKVLFDFFYKTSKLNTNINLSVFYIFNAKKITILSKLKIFLQQSQLDFRTNVPKHDIIIKTKLELSGKKKRYFYRTKVPSSVDKRVHQSYGTLSCQGSHLTSAHTMKKKLQTLSIPQTHNLKGFMKGLPNYPILWLLYSKIKMTLSVSSGNYLFQLQRSKSLIKIKLQFLISTNIFPHQIDTTQKYISKIVHYLPI